MISNTVTAEAIDNPKWEKIFDFGPENFLFRVEQLFVPAKLNQFREKFLREYFEFGKSLDRSNDVAANNFNLGLAPDPIRLQNSWYDVWKDKDITFPKSIAAFNKVIFPPMLRTVSALEGFVAWHQDEAYVRALGQRGHKHVITCFVPLNEDPTTVPTLEFGIVPDQTSIEHIHLQRSANQFDVPEDLLPDADHRVSFKLKLGDALVFGQKVLHRTFWPSPESFPRRSTVEFRITTGDDLLQNKDYFDLSSLDFISTGVVNA